MGGGGFLVWYDSKSGELTTLDGRETAPIAANDHLFQNQNGEPSVLGRGRWWSLCGVPGMPALMGWLTQNGEKFLGSLFTQAAALAKNGFIVSERLSGLLDHEFVRMSSSIKQVHIFFQR